LRGYATLESVKPKLVLVDWVDSTTPTAPWQEVSLIKADKQPCAKCRSIGYLIRETDDVLILAMSIAQSGVVADDDSVGNALYIPQVAILDLWEIGI